MFDFLKNKQDDDDDELKQYFKSGEAESDTKKHEEEQIQKNISNKAEAKEAWTHSNILNNAFLVREYKGSLNDYNAFIPQPTERLLEFKITQHTLFNDYVKINNITDDTVFWYDISHLKYKIIHILD